MLSSNGEKRATASVVGVICCSWTKMCSGRKCPVQGLARPVSALPWHGQVSLATTAVQDSFVASNDDHRCHSSTTHLSSFEKHVVGNDHAKYGLRCRLELFGMILAPPSNTAGRHGDDEKS
jgi:hypothetical protein